MKHQCDWICSAGMHPPPTATMIELDVAWYTFIASRQIGNLKYLISPPGEPPSVILGGLFNISSLHFHFILLIS